MFVNIVRRKWWILYLSRTLSSTPLAKISLVAEYNQEAATHKFQSHGMAIVSHSYGSKHTGPPDLLVVL